MRSRELQAVAALTVLGAILRWSTIDVQSYWFDEALTARLLDLGLFDMLRALPDKELTPPLYYVLAWPWSKLLGTDQLALRSFSALIGTLTIPVAYLAGAELLSRRAGVAAAALTAFNPLLVWYSQEARPYALVVLLGGLSFLFFTRALRGPRLRPLAAWVAVSIAALLAHYFAAFVIVPEAVWLFLHAGHRRRVALAGAVLGLVGIAEIPLAVHQRSQVATDYISSIPLGHRVLWLGEDLVTGLVTALDTTAERLLAATGGLAVIAALGLFMRAPPARPARRAAALAAGVGAAAIVLPLLLALAGLDFLNTRNLILACLPLLLALAVAVSFPRTGLGGAAAAALLCALGVAATAYAAADESLHRDDWRGIARALGRPGVTRAVAVPPISGNVSLARYLEPARQLPAAGAPVREVALTALRRPGSPRRPAPPAPPGFRLVEARRAAGFVVFRYRSSTPRRVRRERLDSSLYRVPPGVLLQER